MAVLNSPRLTLRSCGIILLVSCVCSLFAVQAQANTLVRINTVLGGITLELFDDIAPVTVNNFLNYVTSGRYNGTVIHRLVPGFVIQGGWLSFNEANQQFNPLTPDGTIINEFSVSNTRGTIAMAKVSGDPNSATSQWFINLNDNTELDASNGGFTVFGQVVASDMPVVDAIAALPPFTVVSGMDPFPLINFIALPLQNANLVNLTMAVIENTTADPNVYDATAGLLHTRIDAGSAGLLSLAFSIYAVEPEVLIQAIAPSLGTLSAATASMATYDVALNRLTIPEFVIDGNVAFREVVFELADAGQLLFRLVSAD